MINGHLRRVIYNRCRIDTINFPDDGHMAVRNMQRVEININDKELCVELVIYKDCNILAWNGTQDPSSSISFKVFVLARMNLLDVASHTFQTWLV
jgi:hypothetical protein